MPRSCWTCHVVDLVNFQKNRKGHIVADQIKIGFSDEVGNVGLLRREEIIEADHVVPFVDQSLADVRSEKSCPAGYQDTLSLLSWHRMD